MPEINSNTRGILIALLVMGVTYLHYFTKQGEHHFHILYQGLYYIPLILAGFWFGLRGALATFSSIIVLYGPFIFISWEGFSQGDFGRMMEILHYCIVALILGILRDRENAKQEQLRRAESLAAIGKAMSGVAHDIKTPLIAIGGFTRLVMTKAAKLQSSDEGVRAFVDETGEKLSIVIRETQRLENMVKDMLDFVRPLEISRKDVNIGEIIAESVQIVACAAAERKVRILDLPQDSSTPVYLDTMRMKQVIINLTMNAIQASPEGETVTVRSYRNGSRLIIDVTDCGCGIPLGRREEIFAPFFTTKKEGTGLGLPIVKKIVEAHGGHLQIVDNAAKGLTFRVAIPIGERTRS